MPRGDKTGPQGKGSGTGRRKGNCGGKKPGKGQGTGQRESQGRKGGLGRVRNKKG